ncbi:hypothetical protein [Actinoplanes sp. NPDC026623]|uniref:hypothetical protein n=1 Tax=Actinoplanes sp. NPDC026623 TaxID=3155610 RepID=UPI0033E7A9CA
MSDGPRDQQPDEFQAGFRPGDEPTTGPPAGSSTMPGPATPGPATPGSATPGSAAPTYGTPGSAGPGSAGPGPGISASGAPVSGAPVSGAPDPGTPDAGTADFGAPATGRGPDAATAAQGPQPAPAPRRRGIWLTNAETSAGTEAGPEDNARKRRRRRLFIAGISVGAALIVIATCTGGLAVINAVSDLRDAADDARERQRLRDSACVALETRLNRLVPPGATTTPRARAVAVRNENAATRIYVVQLQDEQAGDGWRQLLDARTAFAEGLEAQAKSRTPAFYVAPESADKVSVSEQLIRWSPAPCAGAIRRLATPDL